MQPRNLDPRSWNQTAALPQVDIWANIWTQPAPLAAWAYGLGRFLIEDSPADMPPWQRWPPALIWVLGVALPLCVLAALGALCCLRARRRASAADPSVRAPVIGAPLLGARAGADFDDDVHALGDGRWRWADDATFARRASSRAILERAASEWAMTCARRPSLD